MSDDTQRDMMDDFDLSDMMPEIGVIFEEDHIPEIDHAAVTHTRVQDTRIINDLPAELLEAWAICKSK